MYFKFYIHRDFGEGKTGHSGGILIYGNSDRMFRELVLADEKSLCIRDWVASSRPLIDRNVSKAAMAETFVIILVMNWLKMDEK